MAPDDQLTTELKLRDRYAPSAENRQGTLCAKPPGTPVRYLAKLGLVATRQGEGTFVLGA
jgi:hypothetical protein